jgi:diguanylate cyclase
MVKARLAGMDTDNSDHMNLDELCSRLLNRLQVPKQLRAEVKPILCGLVSQPEQVNNKDISRLINLLDAAGSLETDRKGGVFERFFGGRAPTADPATSPNQILLNLLQQASWPGHWVARIGQLKDRLRRQPSNDEWVLVLQDLLTLSARSFGEAKKEIKETEDFLGELTQRLQDLDELLRKAYTGRSQLYEHGCRLSTEVSAQVGGLETSLQSASDLQQFKQDARNRMDAIRHSMESFLVQEQQWYVQAEGSEQELRERLSKLEKESSELRHRMLEAHHLALRDPLTGLPNRLAYEERVNQEYARWRRFASPLTMLVWDVDNFKSINDKYGHQAGDEALRVIAQSLKQRLRETDFVARYGGEEFVTLLIGANAQQAFKVAEEMRKKVMESVFQAADQSVSITISCGLSQFAEGDDIESVFARADQAVYQAKRGGKNRCEVA